MSPRERPVVATGAPRKYTAKQEVTPMLLSESTLIHWFTYHPPTAETAPKFAALRAAQEAVAGATSHYEINARCMAFARAIDEHCPDSADKDAAIRCVRIARMALNEALANKAEVEWLSELARAQLLMARWQASAAIACGGR